MPSKARYLRDKLVGYWDRERLAELLKTPSPS